jgi:excisionase family DNA binding protein
MKRQQLIQTDAVQLSTAPATNEPFEAARMLTYAEAAALLKVDKRTVRRRVADGRYTAYGEGSGKRILYRSILADIQRTTPEVR